MYKQNIAYYNGEFLPDNEINISPYDRGFLFGDGVYEVIPVYNGKFFKLKEHIERLHRSLSTIGIECSNKITDWENIINSLLSKNNSEQKAIYLQITRGAAHTRLHDYTADINPTIFVSLVPQKINNFERQLKGYNAITLDDIRWLRSDIKSISLLAAVLMCRQAKQQGADEAILLRDGYVTEGASSNIFIVKDNIIITTPKSNHILGGITRDFVIELLYNNGFKCEEKSISKELLFEADEVWCTSSTREIMPTIKLNGNTVGNGEAGPVWHKAIKFYKNAIQSF